MEKDYFNTLYYLRIFNKWKWHILLPAILASSIVVVRGLQSPRPYTAEATILLSGGSLSLSNPIGGFGVPSLSFGNPNLELIMAMVQSRRMAEDVIDRFRLMEKGYGSNKFLLVQKVKRMIASQEMSNHGLVILVTTKDPQLSSDIANFCVSNLNAMNEDLGITTEKPVAKILDPAVPPVSPSSRRILPRALLAFLIWMTGCSAVVFSMEYVRELRRREQEEQMFPIGITDKDKEQVFS